jgi:hypothetical protein
MWRYGARKMVHEKSSEKGALAANGLQHAALNKAAGQRPGAKPRTRRKTGAMVFKAKAGRG